MHRLLARQIRRHVGGVERLPAELAPLLRAISDAYEQGDADRAMVERSLELSSKELLESAEELRRAEQKFRSIFENATEGIFQVLPCARYVAVNPAMARILGYDSAEDLLNRTPRSCEEHYVDPGRREVIERAFRTAGKVCHLESRVRQKNGEVIWVSETMREVRDANGEVAHYEGTMHDITQRKRAEEERRELQSRLLETSRAAGMAEVATNVVHNIGNAMNSINVSLGVVAARIKESKLRGLERGVDLLVEHKDDASRFLCDDERGRRLLDYLVSVCRHLANDREAVLEEIQALDDGLEHVKRIVAMQQDYARVSGVREHLNIEDLVESAVRLKRVSSGSSGVKLLREFSPVPPVTVDKHEVMQVLVNLIGNADDAMTNVEGERVLTIRVCVSPEDPTRFIVQVQDTGVGITEEQMKRIFNHGYTTKPNGHGFGLHGAALSVSSMGGSLAAHSEGLGKGAIFTLELPIGAERTMQEGAA